MWLIDSAVDTVGDYLPKLYPIQMNKTFDEENHKMYVDLLTAFGDWMHTTLHNHQGHFLGGDHMTIADFAAAGLIFSEVYNEHLEGGHHYRHAGKEALSKHHNVVAYIERLQSELNTYLETRPPAPF